MTTEYFKNENLRIVSLLPSATEIVCALGLEPNLVGITHECDFPLGVEGKPALTASHISHQTMSSLQIDHAVRSQLDGHGSIYSLDEKLLHELNPDLIVTQELCDVCAVSFKTVQQAARIFAGDISIVSLEPNTIEDIFGNIETVARQTGCEERGRKVVNELRGRLEAVKMRLDKINQRPRTLMLEWLEPMFAPGHWVPEQVAMAGGDHAFGRAGEPSVTTTIEEVVAYAPEVIVLIPCGYYIADILHQLPQSNFPAGWNDLPAMKTGDVWAVDATSYFSRPGPRVVNGVEILAKILHPEIFGGPEAHEAVRVSPDQFLTVN
ncbi:MAG: cobalamin-binding protein [Pyrinomonadaceae bacterium]